MTTQTTTHPLVLISCAYLVLRRVIIWYMFDQRKKLTKGGAIRGPHTNIAYAALEQMVTGDVVSSNCLGQTSVVQGGPEATCLVTLQGVLTRNGGPGQDEQHKHAARLRRECWLQDV